jgi:hypothetical protein
VLRKSQTPSWCAQPAESLWHDLISIRASHFLPEPPKHAAASFECRPSLCAHRMMAIHLARHQSAAVPPYCGLKSVVSSVHPSLIRGTPPPKSTLREILRACSDNTKTTPAGVAVRARPIPGVKVPRRLAPKIRTPASADAPNAKDGPCSQAGDMAFERPLVLCLAADMPFLRRVLGCARPCSCRSCD